jgi:hypothetical protein
MVPTGYALGWLILPLLIGAALYTIDRHLGTGWYRAWYDLRHRDPLPEDKDLGFIYGQRARARFSVAVALGLLHVVGAIWFGHANPVNQILNFIPEVMLLFAGFYLGPVLNTFWDRKDTVLEQVDRLEAEGVDVKGYVERAKGFLRKALRERVPRPTPKPEPSAAPAEVAAANPATASNQLEPNVTDVVNRFARGERISGGGGKDGRTTH